MNKALKKAIAAQEALVAAARAEQRDLSEAEQREFDNYQNIIDELKEQGNNERGANDENPPADPPADPPAEPTGNNERGDKTGFTPETATQIMTMCRNFGIEPDNYISRGLSIEDARREVLEELQRRNTPVGTGITAVDGGSAEDKFRAAAVDGILLRHGISVETPAEGANNFRSLPIRDIMVECMEREATGHDDFRHMDPMRLFEMGARSFYNPTAAFPSILDAVIQKSYTEGLKKNRTKFDQWTGTGSLPNFKKSQNHEYIMSLGGTLAKIPENGELPSYKPLDVAMPERQLETYGRQFTMTREAFINDDIGLLTSMPQRYAAMSANTQNELVYSIILNNKTIFDGKPLFDVSRGNTITKGTGVTLKAIETMIYILGMQKDAAGNQLQLMPDLFIVPLGMGTPLRQILASPYIHTPNNTQAYNPYADMNFTIVEDVTINSMSEPGAALPWFMGVKGETIQIDYLNGQKEPNIRRSEKPGTLGFVWDVYHDFGVSVKHPQTLIRNPGVTLSFDAE